MALDLGPKGTSKGGVCEPIPLKEFGAGQLVSIQLAGFMAFKAPVEAFFSPYTNLIASCNGVGKSTIVSAIQFALGCRISSVSASGGSPHAQQQLQRHFTYGSRKASVCLRLKGTEEHELVCIRRDIEKQGEKGVKTTYYLNGEEVRLADIQKQRERLSLRADNYLCFMQQEKVSLFGSLTPKELLSNTLQAINDSDARCLASLQQRQEKLQQLVATFATLRDRRLLLQQEQQALRQQQQDLAHYYNLKRHLTLCHGRIMRLLAGEALKAYKESKAQLQGAHAALQPQVQQLQRRKSLLIEGKQALERREETLRRQLQEPGKSKTAVRQDLDQISAKRKDDEAAAEKLDGCPTALQALRRRLQLQREKALDPHAQRLMLQESLHHLLKEREQQQQQKRNAHLTVVRKGESEENLTELPTSAQEAERALQQQNRKLGDLRTQITNASRQLRSTRGALQEAVDRLGFTQRLEQQRRQQVEQQKQQQKQQVLQALSQLEKGFDIGAVKRGTELLRTHTFRAPVQGPLGAIVAVTDGRVQAIADHFLRGKLLSFLCVDPQEDFLVVSRANLRCFALNANVSMGTRPQMTPALRDAGIEGFLMDFLSVPAAVADAFQEYTMAHLCLVCRPDLSPQQEERMQQTAKQELRQQGCPSQEIVYYLGAQAHRLKQSVYDARGFVHSVTNVPRRPPVLRLVQQQSQVHHGRDEEERNQQQLVAKHQETVEKLRQTVHQLETEQRELEVKEMQEKAARDLLREHLLKQQADAEGESRLRERIDAAAREAAAENRQYRAIAREILALPSMAEELASLKRKRLRIIFEQLGRLVSAAQHTVRAQSELKPFKGKAAAHRKEAEKLKAEERNIVQAEEQLAVEQQKILELTEATQQRRVAYVEAKTAAEGWKKEALGIYKEMLHVVLFPAVAEAQGNSLVDKVNVAEEEAAAEALLAADIDSRDSTSRRSTTSTNSSPGLLSNLPELPPLPHTMADLEALETRLKVQIDRSSRIGSSALEEVSRNAVELRGVDDEMRQTQKEAKALHGSMQQDSERWLHRVEGVVSVLCDRFKALMRAVSLTADGRVSLSETSPKGIVPSLAGAAGAAPAGAAAGGTEEAGPMDSIDLSPLPDFASMRLLLKVTFAETTPLRQLSNTNSGGERSLVAVLYLLAVQAFARGSFRVLDEINQGLDSDREALLFRLLSQVAHGLCGSSSSKECQGVADSITLTAKRTDALAARGTGSGNNKRLLCIETSGSPPKRARLSESAALVATRAVAVGKEHQDTRQKEGQDEVDGGVQYILLTPHIIPTVDLSSIALQFIFNGPGKFTQQQFDIQDQIRRLKARRKTKL